MPIPENLVDVIGAGEEGEARDRVYFPAGDRLAFLSLLPAIEEWCAQHGNDVVAGLVKCGGGHTSDSSFGCGMWLSLAAM